MKRIKLAFVDMYPGHIPENDYYYKLLSRHYAIEISEKPDYIICSSFGHRHVYYDCIKIAHMGENIIPDFNEVDYGVGFEHMTLGDRYVRVPLYAIYKEYQKLKHRTPPPDEYLLNRKFCSFVVSNSSLADPIRIKFFKELSRYKHVDSGGRCLNNIGGPVKNKSEFCGQYKFNIAFENTSSPGYTTEKVMQPLANFVVPIYWGNPKIESDFQRNSLVVVADQTDISRAIEEIIYLDTHDGAYLTKVKMPCLTNDWDIHEKRLEQFLIHIFDQPLEKARRIIPGSYQAVARNRLHRLYKFTDAVCAPYCLARDLYNTFLS